MQAWNYNSHGELSDSDWFIAQFNVLHGRPPTQQEYTNGMATLQSVGSREKLFALEQAVPGLDVGDNYFKYVPDFAWTLAAVAGAAAAVLIIVKAAWKAYKPFGNGGYEED